MDERDEALTAPQGPENAADDATENATENVTENADSNEAEELDRIVTYYEENAPAPTLADDSEDVLRRVNRFRAPKAVRAIPKAVDTVIPRDKDGGRGKYIMLIAAAILIVLVGFIAGAFVFSADAVDKKAERLRQTDSEYLAVKSENATLDASVKSLEESSENIEKTFDSVVEYQKQYDSLNEEYETLKSEYDSLCADYDSLKASSDKMSSQLAEIKKKTVTLTPGVHNVGRQIAAGRYSVTGDGSMLAADANEGLKINTVLNGDAFECELSDGDVIKLETEAKFVPTEG